MLIKLLKTPLTAILTIGNMIGRRLIKPNALSLQGCITLKSNLNQGVLLSVIKSFNEQLAPLNGLADIQVSTPSHSLLPEPSTESKAVEPPRESQEQHRQYHTVIRTTGEGFWRVDSTGHLLEVNPAYVRLSGYSEQELIGLRVGDLEAEKIPGETAGRIRKIMELGTDTYMTRHRRKDGSTWDVEVNSSFIAEDGGYFVNFFRDISERKRNEQELRIAATAFETPEGIIITDVDETIIRVNKAFTRITGYSPAEVIGKTPALMKSGEHDQAFYDEMHRSLKENGSWEGEIWDRHKDGHIYPKWLAITAVYDEASHISHFVGNFTDISERKAYEEKIKSLAYYDTLTALANRRLLTERLEHALERSLRSFHHCALLFLDLDNFKLLNDTQGHGAGDELLIEVANRLKDCVRKTDTVARLGGDEFVVLLEELDTEVDIAAVQVKSLAKKIVLALAEPYHLDHGIHNCSSSMGIVLMTGLALTADNVFAHADTAMYAAKRSGKNTFRFFDPAMQEELEQRTKLESALRLAITEKQFSLFYQPQVDEEGQLLGVEALIRWHHPEQGLIYPGQFIPMAEETDIILSIGRWALETACSQIKAWQDHPMTQNLTIAVNVSAKQFYQTNFVDEVKEIITGYGIDPARLKLELTESMVLKKMDTTIGKMLSLKSLGITLSMDDFGTGYSSLSYLKILPFDQIKIDKCFIEGIIENRTDSFIASSVIELGRLIGIHVIAEGVETSGQYDLLKSLGCTGFQGYYFGKPVPINEIEKQVKHN